jgi:ATP-dependent Clp protease protease subunit
MKKDETTNEDDSERIIFLTDVDEAPITAAMSQLFTLAAKDNGAKKPISIVINTFGGSVYDMFALYDAIKYVQSFKIPVNTIGIGKIMSAGVLLLAAGTTRKIGRNASVMYHLTAASADGNIFDIETDLAETKRMEKLCNELLAENSRMTVEYIDAMLKEKTDIYMTAERAIELGIADKKLGSSRSRRRKKIDQ